MCGESLAPPGRIPLRQKRRMTIALKRDVVDCFAVPLDLSQALRDNSIHMRFSDTAAAYGLFQVVFADVTDHLAVATFRAPPTLNGPEAGPLLPREHHCQIPELGFDFCRIGHCIRDFLAKEVAIPLAKPVNRDFESPL